MRHFSTSFSQASPLCLYHGKILHESLHLCDPLYHVSFPTTMFVASLLFLGIISWNCRMLFSLTLLMSLLVQPFLLSNCCPCLPILTFFVNGNSGDSVKAQPNINWLRDTVLAINRNNHIYWKRPTWLTDCHLIFSTHLSGNFQYLSSAQLHLADELMWVIYWITSPALKQYFCQMFI